MKLPEKKRIWVGVFALVYALALDWCYINVLSQYYEYYGFVQYQRPMLYLVLSYVLAVLPVSWIPLEIRRPSQILYWILYLFVVVPSAIVPFHGISMSPLDTLYIVLAVVGAFLLLGFIYLLPTVQLPRIPTNWMWFWIVFTAITSLLLVYIVSVFGLRIDPVALLEVYSVRFAFRDAVAAEGGFVAYAVIWMGNVISPLLIAYGLIYRRTVAVVAGAIAQLLVYSITGFKSVIFAGVVLVALYFALRNEGRQFGMIVVVGLIVLIGLASIIGLTSDMLLIPYLVVGRMLVTPGMFTGYYYEFFTANPKAYLGHSVLSPIVDYPYGTSPPFLIGSTYFGDAEIRANAHVWADAFANFGFPGIIAFTIMLGAVLWLYDSVMSKRKIKLASLLLAVPAVSLANDALLTSMLTHGIGLMILLVLLMPPTEPSVRKSYKIVWRRSVPRFA